MHRADARGEILIKQVGVLESKEGWAIAPPHLVMVNVFQESDCLVV